MQKRLGLIVPPKPDLNRLSLSVTIKSVDVPKRIVTGEVYPPYIIDSHGDMMEPEDVEYMAHKFLELDFANAFDVMHDNVAIKAKPVESWIARGHPDYNEGAWVLSTKVLDDNAWKRAESGDLGGYSIEAYVRKVEAIVEYTVEPNVFGYVEAHKDHDHAFFAFVNKDGVVTGGYTSIDRDAHGVPHRHIIRNATRTEEAEDHTHRYFLT